MWEFYDSLISTVDDSVKITDFVIGTRWAAVAADNGAVGFAPVINIKRDRFPFSVEPYAGMPVSEMAEGLKSWNYHESALALAAVNAFHNTAENVPEGAEVFPGGRRSRGNFIKFCDRTTAGRHSVMIEPYYDREELSAAPGIFDIVRRECTFRDYIFNAYTELVPGCDQVILSGMTIVDKMIEPVLKCADGIPCILWGPDIPMSTVFSESGISEITSFIADDPERCMWTVKRSGDRDDILRAGHFVTTRFL